MKGQHPLHTAMVEAVVAAAVRLQWLDPGRIPLQGLPEGPARVAHLEHPQRQRHHRGSHAPNEQQIPTHHVVGIDHQIVVGLAAGRGAPDRPDPIHMAEH